MKRIAFICGSLEPGRDGVGDYCRALGAALRALGIEVFLLGLRDRYSEKTNSQERDCLRIPASLPVEQRYALAIQTIADWSPDWISGQFVCWDFGWKGIIGRESATFVRSLQPWPVHFMFHETWVGGAPEMIPTKWAMVRRRALGYLQKRSIKAFMKRLRPSIVQTSNLQYQKNLAEIGVKARLLPIFGNVPIETGSSWDWFRQLVSVKVGLQLPENKSDVVLLGLFGAIRPCPIEPVLRQAVIAAAGRRVVLVGLGGIGGHADFVLRSWQIGAFGIETAIIGLLDPPDLSYCFEQLDAAISLHPASVIGRSGAAAALLEHGVPVICPWGQLPSREDAFAARWSHLLRGVDHTLNDLLKMPRAKIHTTAVVEDTARQVLKEIANAEAAAVLTPAAA